MARLVHACWAVCLAALPAAAEQVLVNPGFEDAGKLAPGWSKQGEVAAGDVARTGQGALKLGKSSRIWQVVALERGVVYHGSVWARGRGTVSPAFYEYTDGPAQGYVWTAACPPVTVGEEWQQVRWSYSAGPNEARLKGICFAVRTNGDDAAVFLDDAAVDREPLPAQPSNLVLNPELADADGDGAPDHWLAERRRLSLETVPGGGRALRVAATLFAEDLLPDPGYGDWWRWDRWGEQHGSGWPALPRPLGGAYTVLLESAAVPIEPGSRYDVSLLLRELRLFDEWFCGTHLGLSLDCGELETLDGAYRHLIDAALAQPQVLVHRDFMPRNLMQADGGPAVLDFQDAVAGPIAYDALSLFKDAFLSWPPERVDGWLRRYHARALQAGLPVPPLERFLRDADLIGVQRHLKVIGIFARLHYRDHKPKYLTDVPRFFAYLDEALPRHPALSGLAAFIDARVKPAMAAREARRDDAPPRWR